MPPADHHCAGPASIAALFHRRWAVPALAEISRAEPWGPGGQRGCKLVWLTHRLDAGREGVRDALDALIELGLVRPNPGYGHPLRPEYLLTARGALAGPACSAVVSALRRADALDAGLRKWAVPASAAIASGAARFGDVRSALGGATDRALSQTLAALLEAGLATRRVEESRPPRPLYTLTTSGRPVGSAGLALASALSGGR